MRKTKKLKYNEKKIAKLIKLPLILLGICLLAFPLSGCINKTQRLAEEFTTPHQATITIIEHGIPGNGPSDKSNGSESGPIGGTGASTENFVENRIDNIPYYFIAICNEPDSKPGDEENIEESYIYLAEMIQKADEYDIKLTLIFSARWNAYIADNPGSQVILNEWQENGHEIIYDTCPGLSNYIGCEGKPGVSGPQKGINEFISSGTVNGIERKWLSCSQIATKKFLNQAIKTFEKLDSRVVYGVAARTIKEQTPFFYAYIDYLHSLDPEGLNSKTLKSIIEKNLVPEKTIPVLPPALQKKLK